MPGCARTTCASRSKIASARSVNPVATPIAASASKAAPTRNSPMAPPRSAKNICGATAPALPPPPRPIMAIWSSLTSPNPSTPAMSAISCACTSKRWPCSASFPCISPRMRLTMRGRVYQTCAHREGIMAIPKNGHGHEDVPRDRDGVPLCPIGLRMHPTYRFLHTKGYQAQRYRCPLLFPKRTGQTCDHEQFLKDKGCVKDINSEKGGLMRAMLDRSSPLYRAVYRQRTSAERINSQAKARGIERPKVRQGDAVRRLNTLTYILINLKALARARAINASLLTPKLGKLT